MHGPNVGRALELLPPGAGPYLIGADPGCNLHIPQAEVEARHAALEHAQGAVRLQDLGSRTGTWVNDVQVERVDLRPDDELRIGRNLFRFLGGADLQARLDRALERLQTHDSLTGLLNRRFFEDTLEREVQRCKRYGRDLSLLLCGLDSWERVRSLLGGLGGDLLVRRLAGLLRTQLGRSDSVGRLGAEGFGVVLPEIDLETARKTADGLRQAARGLPLDGLGPGAEHLQPSLSVGLAALGDEADDGPGLLREAQAELLNARQDGGDQTSGGGTWGR
jgi:diguanylate cyclase (GGDEF)-like protein